MEQRSDDGSNSNASTSGGHVAVEMSIIEELDLRFGSAKNKNQIIHSLEHCAVLHRIPLQNPNATSEQARKDFRRERVLLNDVPFIPDNIDVDRCNAFDQTLNIFVDRIMRRKELYDHELYGSTEAVVDAVLQRACRTSAGADSFFMVQKLLCVEGTFVTQRTYVSDPPIKIDVFEADAEVEGEYLTSSSSRKLPSLPSRSGNHSSNSSYSGIAMDRAELDGHRTPPATPPVNGKSKRSLPSPLKISLKNLGLVKSSSASKHHNQHPSNNTTVGVNAGGSLSADHSPSFTPPTTPSASRHNHNSSHSHSSSGGPEEFVIGGTLNNNTSASNTPHSTHASSNTKSSGSLCCRIQVMNSFAIYDVAAIEEITGVASEDPDPWLEVEAVVVDESNFKTDRHWRKLQLIATCPATGKVYTSAHDASTSSRHSGRLSGRMILQELTSWLTSFPSHLPHAHHDKHHHKHDHNHNKSNSKHNDHNSSNNHLHGTNSPSDQPSPAMSVQDQPLLHTHTQHSTHAPQPHSIQTLHTQDSHQQGRLSPGLSPSISPMSTSTSNMHDSHSYAPDCSFVSVSTSADATLPSEFSPIVESGQSTYTHHTHYTNNTNHSHSTALSLQSEAALHAAALASLQQEVDTPTPHSASSAPHSLKYSTNPSPASPLKGLHVSSSSADAADGFVTEVPYHTHYHYQSERFTEQQERPTDLLTASSFATDRTSAETRDNGSVAGSVQSSGGVYGGSSAGGVYGGSGSSVGGGSVGGASSSIGGLGSMSVVSSIIGSGVYGVRRASATGFHGGSPTNITKNNNTATKTNSSNSTSNTYTNTYSNSTNTTTSVPLPVRTHEDLDLLIPSLRLLSGPRGSGYSSDSSSTADEEVSGSDVEGEGEGVWHDRDSTSSHSPNGSNSNSLQDALIHTYAYSS